MLNHPPERHTFQISKKKWRPHRSESAADIANQKDEKHRVQTGVAICVRSNPWPNEQHRGAGGAKKIPGDCSKEQKYAVKQWRGFAADLHVDAAGDDE